MGMARYDKPGRCSDEEHFRLAYRETVHNTSGFTALPGGYRYALDGTFQAGGTLSYWWTDNEYSSGSTAAWYRRLDGAQSTVYRAATEKPAGKYVRCVKD